MSGTLIHIEIILWSTRDRNVWATTFRLALSTTKGI